MLKDLFFAPIYVSVIIFLFWFWWEVVKFVLIRVIRIQRPQPPARQHYDYEQPPR